MNTGLVAAATTRPDHEAKRAKHDDVAFYRMLLATDPRAASVWLNLGQALMARGCLDEALAAIDGAIAVEKSNFLAWLTRGTLCKSLFRFQEAVAAFLEADRLKPRSAPLLLNLGNAYAELGNYVAAEECLLKAVDVLPSCAEARASLGSVHVRQGRFDLAEAACREALALAPGLVVAHQNLAAMLARTQPDEARAHRDAAYRRQQIFIEPAPHPRWRVLVLCAADAANVPVRGLLPRESCTLINWFVEYAPPGQEAEIPPHDFAFNAIGEPEFAAASAGRIQRFIARYSRPLLNDPAHVARTARHEMPELLGDIDRVVVPPVLRVAESEAVEDAMRRAALAPPVILRPIGTHGGEGAQRIDSWDDLAKYHRPRGDSLVTQFVDTRSPDGQYRKYRVIFVDRVPHPYHLAISRDWLVHYWTARMGDIAANRAEELRFLTDPHAAIGAPAMRALAQIGQRLDLDYAGVDFSILADGRIIVFEANATMLVHSESGDILSYKNPAVQRIVGAFDAMLRTRFGGPAPDVTSKT